jgi:hypothetical protein
VHRGGRSYRNPDEAFLDYLANFLFVHVSQMIWPCG